MTFLQTEAIVYGHSCLSQERLLNSLKTFKSQVKTFHWRMATPKEQRNFLRKNTILVFPVIQIGSEIIQGIPEQEDLQKAWSTTTRRF